MNSVPCSIQVFARNFHIWIWFSKEVLFQSHFKCLIWVVDQSAVELDTPNHYCSMALESNGVYNAKIESQNYKMNHIWFALEPTFMKYLFKGIWKNSLTMQMKKVSTLQLHARTLENSTSKWILFYSILIMFIAESKINLEQTFPKRSPWIFYGPTLSCWQIFFSDIWKSLVKNEFIKKISW